jgi:uncharacterized protein YbcI
MIICFSILKLAATVIMELGSDSQTKSLPNSIITETLRDLVLLSLPNSITETLRDLVLLSLPNSIITETLRDLVLLSLPNSIITETLLLL